MIKYTELAEINEQQAKEFKEHGWCVYTICDEGSEYYRKGYALVNRIGYIVFEKTVDVDYMEESELHQIGIYDKKFAVKVKQITKKYGNTNYHYHMKGKLIDDYECIRTYSDEKANEIIKMRLKYMREIDPSVKAYRFGTGKNDDTFWRKLFSIKKNYLLLLEKDKKKVASK